jgi:arabinose-5-phosphate isomerase
MGMITAQDCVIALSNSGTTPEVLTLLPLLKRLGIPLISMTGAPASALAQASDAHLNTGVETEACPLDLAPTSSTTCTLVMGDALAIALLEARGFTAEDFAFSHPGGALGRKLLLKVDDVMRSGDAIPAGHAARTLAERPAGDQRQGAGHDHRRRRRGPAPRRLHRRRPAPRPRPAGRYHATPSASA